MGLDNEAERIETKPGQCDPAGTPLMGALGAGNAGADRFARGRSTRVGHMLAPPQQQCNNGAHKQRNKRRKSPMRTVALEEHFSAPSIASRIDKAVLARRGYRPRTLPKPPPLRRAP